MKLLKHKKGVNDISIAMSILAIFFLTAAVIPYINDGFDSSYSEPNTDKTLDDMQQEAEDGITTGGALNLIGNVVRLIHLDFGDVLGLPFWLDIFYTLLFVVFILLLARNIWVGGGA